MFLTPVLHKTCQRVSHEGPVVAWHRQNTGTSAACNLPTHVLEPIQLLLRSAPAHLCVSEQENKKLINVRAENLLFLLFLSTRPVVAPMGVLV
jgi:hypothetical protein